MLQIDIYSIFLNINICKSLDFDPFITINKFEVIMLGI